MNARPKILSTKVLPNTITVLAEEHGFEFVQHDFIGIESVPFINMIAPLAKNSWIVFTSRHAVDAVLKSGIDISGHPIASLSGATKSKLEEAGFTVAIHAKNAMQLAELLISAKSEEVTFFCGDIHRTELPNRLRASGITLTEVIVYRTGLTPVKLNQVFDGILFFSPSGVKSFLISNDLADAVSFCIGETTASELPTSNKLKVVIASNPDPLTVFETATSYFTTHVKK
jgi:uroporphyrinogen-III synthase